VKKQNKGALSGITAQILDQNAILHGLEESVASQMIEKGELVHLAVQERIYEPEKTIRLVYFPLDSVLSIVSVMKDGNQIEIGTIGREGVSAFPLLMGASSTANDCYCQVPGTAVQIEAKVFRLLSTTNAGFRQLLYRYLQAYVNMLGQLAACNRLHTVYERCARWLLMTDDRVGLTDIPLTHEYLAMMLGTNRSGVTIAAATLRNAGFIRYKNGKITILDRLGLEDASCECYAVAREQFAGLLRPIKSEELDLAF
jgi:CRP-like cAMP-binding protein